MLFSLAGTQGKFSVGLQPLTAYLLPPHPDNGIIKVRACVAHNIFLLVFMVLLLKNSFFFKMFD